MNAPAAITRRRFMLVGLLVFGFAESASAASWPSGREVVAMKARPFDLTDTRLTDGPFRDAMDRTRRYLHELESDRLLYYFRETAGLDAPGEPMGGWEVREVRGHTMGHYLSACALGYASSGDEKLKEKANAIVTALAKCQQSHNSGYLSAFPESFIDRCLARKPVWAPWYTLHKIYAGLIDMHVYCDNEQALKIVEGMAAWAKGRFDRIDHAQMQEILNHTEQGGMNETLANLYGLTGDARWMALSRLFVQDRYVEPLARREDRLKGEHVNSFIPNIIGTARQYELGGRQCDRDIAVFFWDQVVGARCYCTGGTSIDEHWRSDPHKLADQLGDHTQETCCAYNMLKLTRHLFAWDPQIKYADYYERTLVNSILATQDPDTGMMMYFVTLGPGRWKYFNTPRDSFWCCTGTGLENHTKYGDSIYFHDDDGVWVNLFIASELDWRAAGVRLRQETRFPEEPRTMLTVSVDEPTEFTLRLRIPSWTEGASVRVNGNPVTQQPASGVYLAIRRMWSQGDTVQLEVPMSLWAWPMPDDPTQLAVMYGPLVLAGQLDGEDLPENVVYTTRNWFKFPEAQIAAAPDIVTENVEPSSWVKPVTGRPLTFRTDNVGHPQDVTLVPYHRLWGQRYAVYWRVLSKDRWQVREAERKAREAAEAAQLAALRARLIDRVEIGDPDSESAHGLDSERSATGDFMDRAWRHAPNGWFSYRLKIASNEPTALLCTYWGSDTGRRTFDVLVEGQKIATQTLNQNEPDEFFDVECSIPLALTQGKDKICVKFVAHRDNIAGGLFGLAVLKATK